ncbi:MAG: chemotaxis protein CheW [Gallionella sp.]|nr:chemotaxis protein CheW [Gallionella sp.]
MAKIRKKHPPHGARDIRPDSEPPPAGDMPLPGPSVLAPVQFAAALMPQDAASQKMLAARAELIARPVSGPQHEAWGQYLRFRLGAERYGIPYPYLEELLYVGHLARVPCTPAFVAGVINHRGELLTILDLKQFFRMPAVPSGVDARIIVVKHGQMRAGLLVDAVDGNEKYHEADVSAPLMSNGVTNMEYVLGIHNACVTLLNLAALMDDPALRVQRQVL